MYKKKIFAFIIVTLLLYQLGFFEFVIEKIKKDVEWQWMGAVNEENLEEITAWSDAERADDTFTEGELISLLSENKTLGSFPSGAETNGGNPVVRVLLTSPDGGYDWSDFCLTLSSGAVAEVVREEEVFWIAENEPLIINPTILEQYEEEHGLEGEYQVCLGRKEGETWDYETQIQLSYQSENPSVTKTYEGMMSIQVNGEEIFLVNHIPLEQYLTYVLPSEMPSNFPMEALKAQAICARTYAVRHLEDGFLAPYGADMDDTSAYQVYNAAGTTEEARLAVNETQGSILCYAGEPIVAYYYSCSCGHSTTADIWKSNEGQVFPYLVYKDYGDLEESSPWFSWKYIADTIELTTLRERLLRQSNLPTDYVTVYEPGGNTVLDEAEAIMELGRITDFEIVQRGTGDVVHILELYGENTEGTQSYCYRIEGEYSIRFILGNENYELQRADGEFSVCNMVPSGFFEEELIWEGNEVVGYILTGGGFGHGVGLSQYGAKFLAEDGWSAEEILTYYYENVTIEKVENENEPG